MAPGAPPRATPRTAKAAPAGTPPTSGPAAARPPRPKSATTAAKGLWLYGLHAVAAALANPRRSCHRLLATENALTRLGPGATRPGLEVAKVEPGEIDRHLGPGVVHQGLALSAAPLANLDLERECQPNPGVSDPGPAGAAPDRPPGAANLVVVLDQITDPHNLGAILRSAVAFGARAVVLPARGSAALGGVAAKAASGALDLVPVIEVTNLSRALETLGTLGYWRIALDADAERSLSDLPDATNIALVLGAEGAGLRRLVQERCDFTARLPTESAMASLNVSVAAGISLYLLTRRP